MLPLPGNAGGTEALFVRALQDKDEGVRAGAAEGLARLQDPKHLPTLEKAFSEESKMPARLADAFGAVALGKTGTGEFAPLTYLMNTLNSRSHRGVAEAYLIELARKPEVRAALHEFLNNASKEEKLGIGRILAVSGDKESVARLERLTKDPDNDVAQESVRALRTLRSRLR
jgi:HEAT repeat protein